MFKSAITAGGLAAIVMILYLEFTNPRRMRFQSQHHVDALPELNQFIARFADHRGWDTAMKKRLSTVAEETLLKLTPLDLEENEDDDSDDRQLVVLASSDGPVADLEFIGGGSGENVDDQVRQLQQHDADIITVRVDPPGVS